MWLPRTFTFVHAYLVAGFEMSSGPFSDSLFVCDWCKLATKQARDVSKSPRPQLPTGTKWRPLPLEFRESHHANVRHILQNRPA